MVRLECIMPDFAGPADIPVARRAPESAIAAPRRRAFDQLLGRSGVPPRDASASIWFHGSRPGVDDAVFRELQHGRTDIAIVLTSDDRAAVDALRANYCDDVVAPLPAGAGIARFISRLRPCALVLRDGAPPPDAGRLARVRAADVPILRAYGPRIDDVTLAALHALRPAERRRTSGAPLSWQLPTWRDRVGQSAAWKALAPLLMSRRIDSWAALRDRVRQPRSILCLGNGPSSEDPRLARIEHDCLIRMNWRWRGRGFLERPDIVFVGTPETLHEVRRCVFGFWSERHEYAMLLRGLLTRGPGSLRYFTVERLSPLGAESRWPARPSNGALAIIAAVALAPERIVIGGYDLFAHPAGRYPGDASTRNDYSAVHRRDVELDIIEHALRGYSGEVVVASDILREALQRRRAHADGAA